MKRYLILVLGVTSGIFGQSDRSTINGLVLDPAGSARPLRLSTPVLRINRDFIRCRRFRSAGTISALRLPVLAAM